MYREEQRDRQRKRYIYRNRDKDTLILLNLKPSYSTAKADLKENEHRIIYCNICIIYLDELLYPRNHTSLLAWLSVHEAGVHSVNLKTIEHAHACTTACLSVCACVCVCVWVCVCMCLCVSVCTYTLYTYTNEITYVCIIFKGMNPLFPYFINTYFVEYNRHFLYYKRDVTFVSTLLLCTPPSQQTYIKHFTVTKCTTIINQMKKY